MKKILSFFFNLSSARLSKFGFPISKIVFLPIWFYYHFINKRSIRVFYIHTPIFGEQLAQFQQLNEFAKNTSEIIYFNHHPNISGIFIYNKQIEQILSLKNVRLINPFLLICRMHSQHIEDSLSKRRLVKPKNFCRTLRALNYRSSLFHANFADKFPYFVESELNEFRNYLNSKVQELNPKNQIVVVHSRTNNFKKLESFSIQSNFRDTDFNEIVVSSKNFDIDRFNFVRIGHYEENLDHPSVPKIIDIRKKLSLDNYLQLSTFACASAYFGSQSGALSFFVGQKKPCLLISAYPIDFEYPIDPKFVMVVPKLIYNREQKEYFGIDKQLSDRFMKIQNLYDDKLLISLDLEVIPIPQELTSQIYANWQNSVLEGGESDWLIESVVATNYLRNKFNLPRLGTIPIEYFNYLKELEK
jgi:putative glycosyltransferase (TIGR04372 family)